MFWLVTLIVEGEFKPKTKRLLFRGKSHEFVQQRINSYERNNNLRILYSDMYRVSQDEFSELKSQIEIVYEL